MSAGAAGRRPSPSHLCPDPRIQVKQGGDNSVFYMQDLGLLGIFFFLIHALIIIVDVY